jgi:hypothetical protein
MKLDTLADERSYASTTIVDGLTVTPLPSESPTGQRLSMKCLNARSQYHHTTFVDSVLFDPIL